MPVRLGSELLGTALLVAVVVGSGIMAETLTSDSGVALLMNQLATVFGLAVLIVLLLPASGAHFNPIVTLAFVLRKEMTAREALAYWGAQLLGGIAGTVLAHAMFGHIILEISQNERATWGTMLAEVVASAGLIAAIFLLVHRGQHSLIPLVVPVWIGAAYLFTSSTSFANPAVTLGRMFTDSFSGIAPLSGLVFIGAQLVGMVLALILVRPVITATKEGSNV